MTRQQLNETFTMNEEVQFYNDVLNESTKTSEIDGQHVIGIVEGQFFKPDGMSRNGRWYSRKLWENVLSRADTKNRFLNRTMFGEIGHEDGPVHDKVLSKGEASHFISNLWIDEKGRGMGRAFILNTDSGRNLKTYLGAGCKLKVSTRGEGEFIEGETKDGYPIIDPETYELQTVDFVLYPGFLETNTKLTTREDTIKENIKESVTDKNIIKKGETRMTLDMDSYVQELKEELKALKAENKSLNEELKIKDKELLERQFIDNAELKKLKEEYAPFKKMSVSAKTINETLQRSQKALAESKSQNKTLVEELKAFKEKCGSIEQLDEATKLSMKALDTISEYQKLGSVSSLKKLVEKSESILPQLKILSEYRSLGSVKDLMKLCENCKSSLQDLNVLNEYKKIGTVEDVKKLQESAEKCLTRVSASDKKIAGYKKLAETVNKLLPKITEYKKLAENAQKALPKLQRIKKLEEAVKKAHSVLVQYKEAVGSVKQAKALAESKSKTIRKVNAREALEVSKKYGCTIESAAQLLSKHGSRKANMLLQEAAKKVNKNTSKIASSKKLVEDAVDVDKLPETKNAKEYLCKGKIADYFANAQLGKKQEVDLNKISGKVAGTEAARKLLQTYGVLKAEKAENLGVEEEKEATKENVEKLLK